MKFFILSAVWLCSCVSAVSGAIFPADSVGMEKVDGQVFVLHQVEQKETLYSLSKRYGTSIASITSANPGSENGLAIGQILRIPYLSPVNDRSDRILHEVKPQETLYSIARKYKVTVEDIKKWNNMSMNLLDIGQKITIYPPEEPSDLPVIPVSNTREEVDVTRHTVSAGETLYSLSRKYGTSLEDLRKWNGLEYNDISVGQQIIVKKTATQVKPAPAVNPGTGVQENRPVQTGSLTRGETPDTTNPSQGNASPPVTNGDSSGPATVTVRDSVPERNSDVVYNLEEKKPLARENSNYEEVEEDGLAELIDGSGNNRKYLALHRTATVGTIMRVRNEMNGQEVFVRIIGKLPDTGANRNVLIKISKAAFEQLGAIDNRFRVTVSYIP